MVDLCGVGYSEILCVIWDFKILIAGLFAAAAAVAAVALWMPVTGIRLSAHKQIVEMSRQFEEIRRQE